MAKVINPPLFHYGAIYIDPPWDFDNWSVKGEDRNPKRHYETMTIDEIAALPVGHYADRHAAVFMWASNPRLKESLYVMERWGFKYASVAFVWAKRTKRDAGWHMSTGYWTRANAELCLMGTIGSPFRRSCSVRQLVVSPLRQHSRKPDEVRERIEALVDGPYLEMFSRSSRPGWDCWGKEVGKFDGEEKAQEKSDPNGTAQAGAGTARHHDAV
jgi:N6-adenosine-specific RNA methylase IME4